MTADVSVPVEYQGSVAQNLTKRKGMIMDQTQEGQYVTLRAEIPLNNMFGYAQELRSMTQGKGEFQMEYLEHRLVTRDTLEQLIKKHKQEKESGKKQ